VNKADEDDMVITAKSDSRDDIGEPLIGAKIKYSQNPAVLGRIGW